MRGNMTMARRKIGVIGGGFVGSTTAQRMAEKELGEVVLFDILEGMPQGKALDLAQAAPVCGYETGVIGTNDYADLAGAELVVITAGMPRKPGMDRSDLLKVNGEIQQKVVSGIMEVAPDATLATWLTKYLVCRATRLWEWLESWIRLAIALSLPWSWVVRRKTFRRWFLGGMAIAWFL